MAFIFINLLLSSCDTSNDFLGDRVVEQLEISRVNEMPEFPQPFNMINWRAKALLFDSIAFDFKLTGGNYPIIWLDSAKSNFDEVGFGLYTSLGDIRQGPDVNPEAHEALGALGALIGGSLVGIDKSNQDGHNYVHMACNYFNKKKGWDIIMNFTSKAGHIGGGYGDDWWYDLYNNVLFFALGELYRDEQRLDSIMQVVAEQVYAADSILNGDYSHSYFDFGAMNPMSNHIVPQEDVAAAHAYILYSAYLNYGKDKYLEAAKRALSSLNELPESRFYEILMPFAAYIGARMNAEHDDIDMPIQSFLDWTFDGTATNRVGWGVISDRWGEYDVHGIVGSTVHNGGYGFLMNTFDLAWPLVAMLPYDQRYANAIGKWLLNAANAARLFYPDIIPDTLQALPNLKDNCKGVIAYEGLIKSSTYEEFEGITPFAQGDGPNWAEGMPDETMFSVYGSAHVGMFGGIIQPTDVEGILQVDCKATDFIKNESYPTYLLYNPHGESKRVSIRLPSGTLDLYDAINREIVASDVNEIATLSISANESIMIVCIPHGTNLTEKGGRLYAGKIIIDYRMQ